MCVFVCVSKKIRRNGSDSRLVSFFFLFFENSAKNEEPEKVLQNIRLSVVLRRKDNKAVRTKIRNTRRTKKNNAIYIMHFFLRLNLSYIYIYRLRV